MIIEKVFLILKHIKGNVFKRSIKLDFMLSLIFIAIIPATIINLFYFDKINTFTQGKIKTYNTELVKQIGDKLDYLFTQIEIKEKQLISISVSSSLFADYFNKSKMEKIYFTRQIEDLLKAINHDTADKSDIYLIDFEDNIYSTNYAFDKKVLMESDFLKEIRKLSFADMIIPAHFAQYHAANRANGRNVRVISFVRNILNITDNKSIETIIIDLNYDEIQKIAKSVNIGEGGNVIITDSNNKVVYCKNEKFLDKDISEIEPDKSGSLTITHTLLSTGWKIIGIIPTRDSFMQVKELESMSFFIIIITIVFSLFISYFITKGIVRPISRIMRIMKKIGEGEFNVTISPVNYRELQVLSKGFGIMTTKIENLMKNIIEKETEKTTAQMLALQSQINPHFLNNTLATIRGIALSKNEMSIVDICKSMARLFKYSISKGQETVSLREEIENIRDYINIQKYRYPDRFEVIFDISEEIYELKVIRLILQPLVENAFFHGIELKKEEGQIKISACKIEGDIIISVADNGLGMTDEQLDYLRMMLESSEWMNDGRQKTSKGIGVLNVNSRIKLYYGDGYGLDVESHYCEGTVFRIRIPA